MVGATNNLFFQSFFQTKIFFFRNKKIFFKEQLLFSFLCIVKQKKNFGVIRKFLKIFIFKHLLHKKGPKGEISIDADSGPPRYVLWCCGGICHQPDTFFMIGSGHTVDCKRDAQWAKTIRCCFLSRRIIHTLFYPIPYDIKQPFWEIWLGTEFWQEFFEEFNCHLPQWKYSHWKSLTTTNIKRMKIE